MAHVKAGTSIKQEGIQLIIFFNEEVRIIRTTIDTFSSIESLNILGSNLGLWPGLGKVMYCREIFLIRWVRAVSGTSVDGWSDHGKHSSQSH